MSRCRSCDIAKSQAYYADHKGERRNRYIARKFLTDLLVPKKCKTCDRPALSSKHWYCAECGKLAERVRGHNRQRPAAKKIRDARRYDNEHRLRRRAWVSIVATGTQPCARCGKLIPAGAPWDLGHKDDGSGYAGPEHRACNRATAGRKKAEPVRAW